MAYDINSILDNPISSSPIGGPPSDNQIRQPPTAATNPNINIDALKIESRPLGENAPTETAKDVGRAILKTPPRVLYSAPGIPGSIEEFALRDVPTMARNAALWGGKKLDIISPNEYEKRTQEPVLKGPEGKSPLLGLPTYGGRSEEFRKEHRGIGTGGIDWGARPETPEGRVAESLTEGAIQGIPGAMKGILGRVATGGLGAGFGRAAEEWAPDSPVAPIIANVIGSGVGGIGAKVLDKSIGSTAKGLIAPSLGIRRDLEEAIAEDLRDDPTRATRLRDAVSQGQPVTMWDLATGPRASALIDKGSFGSIPNQVRARELSDFLKHRAEGGKERTTAYLSNMLGRNGGLLNVANEDDLVRAANAAEVNRLYEVTGPSGPSAADSIHSDEFGAGWVNRPLVQQAMQRAETAAANNPDWHIRPPTYHTVSGVPDPIEVPGNLAYWDQVKKELDHMAKFAERNIDPNANASQAPGARAARSELVSRLDTLVPEYELARDTASEVFGAAHAPAAGEQFYRASNDYRVQDIANAARRYSPEQRELFALGFARGLIKDVGSGGVNSVYDRLIRPETRERAIAALGADRYESILGRIAQERMLQDVQGINLSRPVGTKALGQEAAHAGALGALTGAAALGAETFASNLPFVGGDLGPLGTAALVAGGTAALSGLHSVAERRIGERLVALATDVRNPRSQEELGRLLNQQPSVLKIFNKMNLAMGQAAEQSARQFVSRPLQEREDRAKTEPKPSPGQRLGPDTLRMLREQGLMGGQWTGGRVGRASGGRISKMDHASKAAALVRMADKVRTEQGNETEAILDQPDAHVIKALKVANENI